MSEPSAHGGIHAEDFAAHAESTLYQSQEKTAVPLVAAAAPKVNRVVFGYHPYWMGDAFKSYRWDLLTHVAYFGARLSSDGSVGDVHGWPNTDLINEAHRHGVKVVLVVTNFSSAEITTLLGNASARTNAVRNLVNTVKNGGGNGVNIDFEYVPVSRRAEFVAFLEELATTFHREIKGSHVSVATPAVDWWGSYDYNGLARAADALYIMAYDYHWRGSNEAGPVSPFNDSEQWGGMNVVSTAEDYFTKTHDNRSKLILGVPYYGYDWRVRSGNVPSATIGRGTARTYAKIMSGYAEPRLFDADSQSPYFKYQTYYQMWYENANSLAKKYSFVKQTGMGGVGIWALGYDGSRTELWDQLRTSFTNTKTAPSERALNANLRVITGAGPGGGAHIRSFSAGGTSDASTKNVFAYPASMRQGVFVATGDVDGDGKDEMITAPRAGAATEIKVFEQNGTRLPVSFVPFGNASKTGADVAAGDGNGDGRDDIAVVQSENGQAWVKVYQYGAEKKIIGAWNAFGGDACGGSVAMGDVNGDGKAEVIVGSGPGCSSRVKVFSANGKELPISYEPFHPNYRGGVSVAAGDMDGDGKAEVVVSQMREQAWVKIYRYSSEKVVVGEWRAFDSAPVGGLVNTGDVDGDGKAEVVVGGGPNGGPHVRAFETNGSAIRAVSFFAYDKAFRGGADVACLLK